MPFLSGNLKYYLIYSCHFIKVYNEREWGSGLARVTILVLYCCVTNHLKFRGLKKCALIISQFPWGGSLGKGQLGLPLQPHRQDQDVEVLGTNPLRAHSGCCQNSLVCGCRTEGTFSLLGVDPWMPLCSPWACSPPSSKAQRCRESCIHA